MQALLYEVNNTFGERHSYLIPVEQSPQPEDGTVRQRCDKRLFVSPFLDMQMHYRFRVRPPAPGAELLVGVDAHDDQGPVLVARLHARPQPLGDAALLRSCLTHPLLTFTVVAAIHWEALRLWCKGVGLHLRGRPAAPSEPVTTIAPRSTP